MATAFPGTVSAAQIGSYFVGQYYQVLQQQRDLVHQFYTDASTMLRVDGNTAESVTTMLQIHALIMCLNFTEIEIKTAHSLDSWNGGVLVMVSGSVQTKDYKGRRNFAQTFFLAPQEKGYFVLNDMFHFLDAKQIPHPAAILEDSRYDSRLNSSSSFPEPGFAVSNYEQGGETQTRKFEASTDVEENDSVEHYFPPEEQEYHFPEVDKVEEQIVTVEETAVEEACPAYLCAANNKLLESTPITVGEPPKKTYASILRVASGQSALPVAQPSANKSVSRASEWHHASQPSQHAYPATRTGYERSTTPVEEVAAFEEGEGRSVYLKNLSPTVSASEIEQELKNFGKIKPDGVAIRNRQDIGVFFAFVEFEDASSAQNAIKASPIHLSGRQVYVEERRVNTSNMSRGGRGRGSRGGRAGGYLTDNPRGGVHIGGRSFGKGSGQEGDYFNRSSRGNGFYQQGSRQDSRGIL